MSVNTEDLSIPCSKVSGDLGSSSNTEVPIVSVPRTAQGVEEILQSTNLKSFTSTELQVATRNFRVDNVLGHSVFKGWIDEHSSSAAKPGKGIAAAVKRLYQDGFKGHKELFVSLTHHINKQTLTLLQCFQTVALYHSRI